MRSLIPVLRSAHRQCMRPAHSHYLRALATKAATPKPKSIASLLSTATASAPLKDAVKFVREDSKATIWTFRELTSHVNALASGLHNLGYTSGHRIVTLLQPHSPEYAVLLLTAAQLRLTLIALPYPATDDVADVHALVSAMETHAPIALVLAHHLLVPDVPEYARHDDRIVAAVNPVLNALDPHLALRDTAGLAGCVPITGRSFSSDAFPSLRHVIHTGDQNVRSAITFRSLLVYDGAQPAGSAKGVVPPLLQHGGKDGAVVTEQDVLRDAVKIGGRLNLSANHQVKGGKVVVKSDISRNSMSTAVAALMHRALWLSPHPQTVDQVSAEENAVVP